MKSVACKESNCKKIRPIDEAVSYTHLDVYKRQPLTNPYEITNNCGAVMKFLVLFNGKPVQHKKVFAMYEGRADGKTAGQYHRASERADHFAGETAAAILSLIHI